ncbi:PREDICTED: pentatricopeptide repeat-containing protein At1g10270-like [Camelina sativa]|uniref:Pentatricopeptide repeat-containing protein At1g10270-like n=1 Tax=Camelina sativa TaxID=90675 RepID=A0ABM0T061_CAMSA|nr:PREDICTED: pentatricopeptide repeat-containing protein At1g10270-like [Camelina sativa]
MSTLSYLNRASSIPSSPPPMSKFESDPSSIHRRVTMLIKLSNLDAAAEHARLAILTRGELKVKVTANTCCVAIIDALCSAGRYSEAYELFHFFAAKSNSDIICCDPIINAFCDQGKLDEALELYHHSGGGLLIGSRTQLALAQGLVNAGRIDEAMDLFYCVNRSLYDIFIRGFLDMGNHQKANQLFQELKLSGDLDAVLQVRATFIDHWFKQGMDEKAMKHYIMLSKEEFSQGRIHVTAGNTLLKVLLRYGKKTEAWSLFSQMLEQSRFRGLEGYCNARKFDSESCNIMVNECFKLGHVSQAINIFHKIVGTISDPQLCYRNMITRFCEHGMLSDAERFFADMCSENYLVPDVPTYRTMMDAYVKELRISDARKTVNQTLDACLTYISKQVV